MWILLTHVTVYTALPFKFFVCKLKFVFLVMACKTRAWKAGWSRGVNFTTLQEINGFLTSQIHVIYSKIYTLLVLARWDTITYFWAVLPPITSCLNDRIYMYWYHAAENAANQITGKHYLFTGMTSNILIVHHMYIVMIVLATVFSIAWYIDKSLYISWELLNNKFSSVNDKRI